MKLLILMFVVVGISGKECHIKANENVGKFQEDIKNDFGGNTEEIKVPQLQGRAALNILDDLKKGYLAMKDSSTKICYIWRINPSNQNSQKMKESMKLVIPKFPKGHYILETYKSLHVRKMTSTEVGRKIAAHCKGHGLILTGSFEKARIENEIHEN